MRRNVLVLVVLAALCPDAQARSSTVAVFALPPAVLSSGNVTYVATIPIDSPGVGGRVLRVGGQVRFYVTGAKGLTIYDVTNPALPLVIGTLAAPHFQNEDVDVSDDGSRVVIAADTTGVGVRLIDTSDPANPKRLGHNPDSNHTATCADPRCDWIYGSTGRIYDARDPLHITRTDRTWGPRGHALNRDAAGIMVSDQDPRRVLDVSDPLEPVVLATGTPVPNDGYLQHNNVRPRADQWSPREDGDTSPDLRPGELLIGNSESNETTTCQSYSGGLTTWSMVDFDKGVPMRPLHTFRPVSGRYVGTGDPPVNGLGCSGHWFTERDEMVAAGWYEHGIRFFHVEPTDGRITPVGFFQPVATSASAAHWIDDEYVYSVDYARGIDILRFDRSAAAPSAAELDASWQVRAPHPAARLERFNCRVD